MKNWLSFFKHKKKQASPSFKSSDFAGKYHESIINSPFPKPNSKNSVIDNSPPPYIPVAKKGPGLPEHYTVESSKAGALRLFAQLTQLVKIVLFLLLTIGVAYIFLQINQKYGISDRLLNYYQSFREKFINGI